MWRLKPEPVTTISVFCQVCPWEFHQNQRALQRVSLRISPESAYSAKGILWNFTQISVFCKGYALEFHQNQSILHEVPLGCSPKSASSARGTPWNFTKTNLFCKGYPSKFHQTECILQTVSLELHQHQHILQEVSFGIASESAYSARGIPGNFTKINVFYKRYPKRLNSSGPKLSQPSPN